MEVEDLEALKEDITEYQEVVCAVLSVLNDDATVDLLVSLSVNDLKIGEHLAELQARI